MSSLEQFNLAIAVLLASRVCDDSRRHCGVIAPWRSWDSVAS